MTAEAVSVMLDTTVVIHRRHLAAGSLQGELCISAVTLAELSAGVHMVNGNGPDAVRERARRIEVLQRAEHEFDPIAFGAQAARVYGRISATVLASGRQPRRRTADLMIAATAATEGMSLYTMNPAAFVGLEEFLTVRPVRKPSPG